jgi:hypothetical protein
MLVNRFTIPRCVLCPQFFFYPCHKFCQVYKQPSITHTASAALQMYASLSLYLEYWLIHCKTGCDTLFRASSGYFTNMVRLHTTVFFVLCLASRSIHVASPSYDSNQGAGDGNGVEPKGQVCSIGEAL